jgi:hypothetical protein
MYAFVRIVIRHVFLFSIIRSCDTMPLCLLNLLFALTQSRLRYTTVSATCSFVQDHSRLFKLRRIRALTSDVCLTRARLR